MPVQSTNSRKKRLVVWGLLLVLCLTPALSSAAPNKIWLIPGTPLKFADGAQSPAVTFTMTGMAAGSGQYSARYDKDALKSPSGAMPWQWRWSCAIQLSGSATLNDVVQVLIAKSDGIITQGGLGATTAALSSAQTKNLSVVGHLVVDATAANPVLLASGDTDIKERYFSLALFNATSLPFVSSTSAHTCYMTPMTLEIQAYAPLDYDRHPAPAPVPVPVAV